MLVTISPGTDRIRATVHSASGYGAVLTVQQAAHMHLEQKRKTNWQRTKKTR